MGELLHAGAFASAAVGACCVAADRPATRVPELVLSLLMLAAMVDVALAWSGVPAVCWAVVLVVAGVGSAIGMDRRTDPFARGMRAADAVGGILMAGLLLVMAGGHPEVGGGHGEHGSAAPALVLTAASLVYATACVGLARRISAHPSMSRGLRLLRRMQPIAMGASAVLMASAGLA